MKKIFFVAFLFLFSCSLLSPSDGEKSKSDNVLANAVCDTSRSHIFYGVTTKDTLYSMKILSGVEIRVDILPFGFAFFDTTDSFGLYGIEYPCPLLPVYQYYVITATNCLGNTEQRVPILLDLCAPVHNSFNF